MASRDLPDPLQQFVDLIEEAGFVIYYTHLPTTNTLPTAHARGLMAILDVRS